MVTRLCKQDGTCEFHDIKRHSKLFRLIQCHKRCKENFPNFYLFNIHRFIKHRRSKNSFGS